MLQTALPPPASACWYTKQRQVWSSRLWHTDAGTEDIKQRVSAEKAFDRDLSRLAKLADVQSKSGKVYWSCLLHQTLVMTTSPAPGQDALGQSAVYWNRVDFKDMDMGWFQNLIHAYNSFQIPSICTVSASGPPFYVPAWECSRICLKVFPVISWTHWEGHLLRGGDTRMTPSPRTKRKGIALLFVCIRIWL